MNDSFDWGDDSLYNVVAIVETSIIYHFDVLTKLKAIAEQNSRLDIEDKNLFDEVLDHIIAEKLLLAKAIKDSVVVTEDEFEQKWDFFVHSLITNYGSIKKVEEAYQMSVEIIKETYYEDINNHLLVQNLLKQKFEDVKVSHRDVEEFYYKNIDTLSDVPMKIKVSHILININEKKDDSYAAIKLLEELKTQVLKYGKDFSELAKQYSDDKETRDLGGLLGTYSIEELTPHLAKILQPIKVGEISDPVTFTGHPSKQAYHIIYKNEVIEEHKPDLVRDFDELEKQLKIKLQIENKNKWVEELKEEIYWEKYYDSRG